MDISAILGIWGFIMGAGSLGMSHGEDIPLENSQKAKEPNRIGDGELKLGDPFNCTDFQSTTKKHSKCKRTAIFLLCHWSLPLLFSLIYGQHKGIILAPTLTPNVAETVSRSC